MADYNCSQPFLFLFYNKKTNHESMNHEPYGITLKTVYLSTTSINNKSKASPTQG